MNGLLKTALAFGSGAAAAEVFRRALSTDPKPRYEPWERPPFSDFPNRVLILGGGFAGYTAAKTLCKLTRHRDELWGSCSSPGRTTSPSGPCSLGS